MGEIIAAILCLLTLIICVFIPIILSEISILTNYKKLKENKCLSQSIDYDFLDNFIKF